jgi:hypothetical protein
MKPKCSLPCSNSLPLVPVLSARSIHSMPSYPTTHRFPPPKLCMYVYLSSSSIHTVCPTYHILLDLTTLLISDKDKSEVPHYTLISILLLNTTISIVLNDYGYPYASCTHTLNTEHCLTNYIKISIKTNKYVTWKDK